MNRTKVTLYKTDFHVDHEDCPVSASCGMISITVDQDITELSGFLSEELLGELAHMVNAANRPVQAANEFPKFGTPEWHYRKAQADADSINDSLGEIEND